MCFSAAATSFASLVYLKKHATTLPFWIHITLRAWLFYHGRARWRSRHSRYTPVPSNFKQSRQITIWYNADGAACNSKGKSGSSHWSLNEGCLYNSMAAVCCQSHCVTDRFRQSAGRLSPVCSHTHINKSALFFFWNSAHSSWQTPSNIPSSLGVMPVDIILTGRYRELCRGSPTRQPAKPKRSPTHVIGFWSSAPRWRKDIGHPMHLWYAGLRVTPKSQSAIFFLPRVTHHTRRRPSLLHARLLRPGHNRIFQRGTATWHTSMACESIWYLFYTK